jgi:dTDP-4-dehydrorhamnose reductase
MKIAVTGSNGLLGQHLVQELLRKGYEVHAISRGEDRIPLGGQSGYYYYNADIRDGVRMKELMDAIRPEVMIHCAAMTQVDECELNKPDCYNSNVTATRFIIDALKPYHSKIIYLSTDFVFDGKSGPYKEEDPTNPVNYYGSTKVQAEKAVQESGLPYAIVRTILVYGSTIPGTRKNIRSWIIENLKNGHPIKVVSDQIRNPTHVEDLAKGIVLIIEKHKEGIFHLGGPETMSPYDMAMKIAELGHFDKSLIQKVDASSFSQPAERPKVTGLDISKARKELGYEPREFTMEDY